MQDKSTELYKSKIQATCDKCDYYYDNFKAYFNYKQHYLKVFRLLQLWKNRKN